MKFYTALVNTLSDGRHIFTDIRFLVKRHRVNGTVEYIYTVKIEYSRRFEDHKNDSIKFKISGDWKEAILHAFNKEIGWMGESKLEHLAEVEI